MWTTPNVIDTDTAEQTAVSSESTESTQRRALLSQGAAAPPRDLLVVVN